MLSIYIFIILLISCEQPKEAFPTYSNNFSTSKLNSWITPCNLFKVRTDLLEIYNKEISTKEILDKDDDILNCDLNQVVNKLEEFTEGHKGKQGRRKKATDISEMIASS